MKPWFPLILALALPALAACGFTPLYATPGLANSLQSIEVVGADGRVGQLIREHLDDGLARDVGHPARYRMDLHLTEQRFPRGLRVDNVATRYEYVLIAAYDLRSLASGAVIKSGTVRAEVTYDSADQPYASVSAQQDAQDRAAAEAARRIQLDLATWLAARTGP